MKKTTLLFSLLTAIAFPSLAGENDTIPAFPGAEGFGRYTQGGRGGQVIHVTNLKDDGQPGCLRWALKQSGKKIVVFDVGGTIDLTSQLNIPSDVTIAGQTAPGPGITLRYYTLCLGGNNAIVRFIRVRRGNAKDVNDGADASWGRHCHDVILDHNSYSWSIDETASFYDNRRFTMQWCTVGESLSNAGHDKGAHGYGGIWGGRDASFHHNLLIHHNNRTPRLCGARYGYWDTEATVWTVSHSVERDDVRNCVIYNWGNGAGAYGGMGGNHNLVNNYYKYGPATRHKYNVFNCCEGTGNYALPKGVYGKFYIKGNYVQDKGMNYDWHGVTVENGSAVTKDTIKSDVDFGHGTVTTHSALKAFDMVLKHAGASLTRDVVDERYAREAMAGTAQCVGSATMTGDGQPITTHLPGIIDTQEDAGGYPILPEVHREADFDTDGDGIPNAWELANGLDPDNASDGNTFSIDPRHWYSNVEVYINSLVQPIMLSENEEALESVDEYYPPYYTRHGERIETGDDHLRSPAGTTASTGATSAITRCGNHTTQGECGKRGASGG